MSYEIPPFCDWEVGVADPVMDAETRAAFAEVAAHNQTLLDAAVQQEREAVAEALLEGRGCSLLEARWLAEGE